MRLRRRRYNTGGGIPPQPEKPKDVNALLEMLSSYGKDPGQTNVLQSIVPDPSVSESTQPSGYTLPIVDLTPFKRIEKPFVPSIRSISDEEWEESNAPISWLELFADPMRAFRFYNQNQQFNAIANVDPSYKGRHEPFRRPTKDEFEATGGSAMDFAGQAFNPATYIQTAVELDKDLTELDRTIIAAFEDGSLSGSDLDRVGGQLTDAGLKTLFLVGGASMLKGSGVGSFKVPASDVSKGRAVFGRNLGEAADDFIGSGVQQTGPLRQLAGSNLPIAASNVPAAASEAGLFGNKLTFKGLRDFFLPKPELTLQSGQLSLKDVHSDKMTDAMLAGEKFVSQYYLNANTLDRLGSLYGPLGTGQLYDLGINKTFDNIASNLKSKDFSYTYPGGSITYSGDQLQNQIKKLYTERAIWSTSGVEKGSELFPFELSRMTSTEVGGGRLQGSYGTYANRHFPGVLVTHIGGMGRTRPFSTVEQFTPAEILEIYGKEPFGVHPDSFKQSLIETYGADKGLERYENIGGLRYEATNEAGNLVRTYGLKSDVSHMLDKKGRFTDPSRSWSNVMKSEYYGKLSTVVHEMNHYYFGMANLPNELIVPWMQHLTDEANFHLFSRYPKGKIKFEGPESVQYYAQPVEIQARTGELRYQLVSQILRNKGITLSRETSHYDINKAIDELEIIIKRGDEDAFNNLFGGENDYIAGTIGPGYKNILKGGDFKEKRASIMELMKIVPVVGAPLVLGAALGGEEDLPILGYKKGGVLNFLTKKYGAGGTVEEFGAQGNFDTEYESRLPEVEEPSDPNEEIIAETIIEADAEIDPAADLNGDGEVTEAEKKKYINKKKGQSALSGAASGALVGASFGPWGAVIGGVVGGAAGWLTGKDGMKIKKKKYDDGGLLEMLRDRKEDRQERRNERIKERGYRRVGKADIRPFDSRSILDSLAGDNTAGFYLPSHNPGTRFNKRHRAHVGNVALNPITDNTGKVSSVKTGADDSVLDHELIHASQYGPLQKLASYFGSQRAGRIQDKDTRKAYKNLMKSIRREDTTLDENLGGPAQADYMTGARSRDIEFDAIVKSGLSSASAAGYDLEGKSFDEIIGILKQAEKDENASTNMGHLNRFMRGTNWSDEQKGFIMDAIKTNVGRKAYTTEDARQDLRYDSGGKTEPPYTGKYSTDDMYKLMALVEGSSAPEGTTYNVEDDTMDAPDTSYVSSSSERIKRQLFKESGGEKNPDIAVSPAGAMGRWQIMPATQRDLENRGFIPEGLDPANPEHNRQMRDAKIKAILKTSLVSNPPKAIPEVNKLARIYASYNFGEGNVRKALNKASEAGVDIYNDPRLWLDYLPEETKNYVNYILFYE